MTAKRLVTASRGSPHQTDHRSPLSRIPPLFLYFPPCRVLMLRVFLSTATPSSNRRQHAHEPAHLACLGQHRFAVGERSFLCVSPKRKGPTSRPLGPRDVKGRVSSSSIGGVGSRSIFDGPPTPRSLEESPDLTWKSPSRSGTVNSRQLKHALCHRLGRGVPASRSSRTIEVVPRRSIPPPREHLWPTVGRREPRHQVGRVSVVIRERPLGNAGERVEANISPRTVSGLVQ